MLECTALVRVGVSPPAQAGVETKPIAFSDKLYSSQSITRAWIKYWNCCKSERKSVCIWKPWSFMNFAPSVRMKRTWRYWGSMQYFFIWHIMSLLERMLPILTPLTEEFSNLKNSLNIAMDKVNTSIHKFHPSSTYILPSHLDQLSWVWLWY